MGSPGMRPRYHPLQLLLTARIIAVLSQWKLLRGPLDCVHLGLCGAFLVQNCLEQEVNIEITAHHRPSCFLSMLAYPSLVLLRTTHDGSIAPSFCLMCRLRPSKVPGHIKPSQGKHLVCLCLNPSISRCKAQQKKKKVAEIDTLPIDLPAYFHSCEQLFHPS